jgi:hypothetical protein
MQILYFFKINQIYVRLRIEHQEFRPIEILRLSFMVPEKSAFIFIFLALCDNSVMIKSKFHAFILIGIIFDK